jgi:hypothetical protein
MSGHRDWQTLKRYTHIKATDVHAAYNALSIKQGDMKNVDSQLALILQKLGDMNVAPE